MEAKVTAYMVFFILPMHYLKIKTVMNLEYLVSVQCIILLKLNATGASCALAFGDT